MSAVSGIDVPKVTAWLQANIPDVRAPLTFEMFTGGRSNLTYRVTDAAGRDYVLRRPPPGRVLPTAHDMGREHRILAALGATGLAVPSALGYCDDHTVNGSPFYVMSHVDGLVVRTEEDAAHLDHSARCRAGEALIDELVRIHAVGVDGVGLGDLARKDSYVARQLKRWNTQYEASRARGGPDVPVVAEVHDVLLRSIPTQAEATLVHGDYRLENAILGRDGSVRAVLDWEICTLGDPLADLGLLMVYWTEQGDSFQALAHAPTALPGFCARSELRARYAERSGRDIAGLDFYVAFAYWKLACVIAGVFTRYASGSGGGDQGGYRGMARHVHRLAEAAARASGGLG